MFVPGCTDSTGCLSEGVKLLKLWLGIRDNTMGIQITDVWWKTVNLESAEAET